MDSAETKTLLLMRRNTGKKVSAFTQTLRKALGDGAATYYGLTAGDQCDADTKTALCAWQLGVGLAADGIAGPRTPVLPGVSPAASFSRDIR